MVHIKKEATTYIGCAEIRKENTTRRDALVKAAKEVGFIVDCSEAVNISLSGATSPVFWAITVKAKGSLDRAQVRDAKMTLKNAWNNL